MNALIAFIARLTSTFKEIHIVKHFSWTGYKRMATYFTDEEVQGLDKELISKLDTARKAAGIPFLITSGLRTCAANAAAMGADHSAHIKGLAVDLGLGHLAEGYERDHARMLMKRGLYAAGFVRLGAYDLHVHVDVGQAPEYAQQVEWQKSGQ